MKRALVFMVLGPALVSIETWMFTDFVLGLTGMFVGYLVMLSVVCALPASAVAGLVDSRLARSLPALLRAPLTAVISVAISVVLVLVVISGVFLMAT